MPVQGCLEDAGGRMRGQEESPRKLERTRRMIPRIRIMWPVLPQYSAEREKGALGVMGCICFQELH
jgi:hypothetical protein